MRCPYCNGLNSDRARYCAHCGRDMAQAKPAVPATSRQQPPSPGQPVSTMPPAPTSQRPMYPPSPQPIPRTPTQASQPPRSAPPPPVRVQPPPTKSVPVPVASGIQQSAPTAEPMPAPAAPAPFPPRTLAQLKQLEPGAIGYTVVEETVNYGRRKVVRIAYPRCAAWQQVATLLKALNGYQSEKFETIIIQGILPSNTSVYAYNNGQLQLDRNVRLGSQILNRYQIETGNGFDNDTVRIVITE